MKKETFQFSNGTEMKTTQRETFATIAFGFCCTCNMVQILEQFFNKLKFRCRMQIKNQRKENFIQIQSRQSFILIYSQGSPLYSNKVKVVLYIDIQSRQLYNIQSMQSFIFKYSQVVLYIQIQSRQSLNSNNVMVVLYIRIQSFILICSQGSPIQKVYRWNFKVTIDR